VIGLVQVGEQARADRYAYLPLVGLQIALVFGVDALVQRHARLRALAVALGIAALAALGSATFRRSAAWRDSHTLYARALEVSPRNYAAHIGLANELVRNGRADEARAHYEAALAIRPEHPLALYSYGLEEQQRGETERALELYRRAIASLPRLAAAHLNLGALLAQRGELDAARQEFEAVLAVQPDQPDARFNLALLALLEGRPAEALEPLAAVVEARPDHWMAREKLGDAYEALGRHSEAIAAFERALRVHASPNAQRTLAWILATAREDACATGAAALELAQAAVRASGRRDPVALEALAAALAETGDFARAAGVEEEALRLLVPSQAEPGRARLELYRAGRPFPTRALSPASRAVDAPPPGVLESRPPTRREVSRTRASSLRTPASPAMIVEESSRRGSVSSRALALRARPLGPLTCPQARLRSSSTTTIRGPTSRRPPTVRRGLTLEGLRWGVHVPGSNWHPLNLSSPHASWTAQLFRTSTRERTTSSTPGCYARETPRCSSGALRRD
jgi:tetratricopeptide (TPR) repeat protein